MANNEARHESYIVPSKEQMEAMENEVLEKLDAFSEIIASGKTHRPEDTSVLFPVCEKPVSAYLAEKLVLAGMELSDHIGGVQYFCADENCSGCGLCERVCLSGKIAMEDKKPVWQRNIFCTMCFACLNYCPRRAVQINDIPGVPSFTKVNGRYPHPYASAKDIEAQKSYTP